MSFIVSYGTPATSVLCGRIDCRIRREIVSLQLHHAAGGVSDEDVIVAILLVRDHVQRLIACAEIGDFHALHLSAGLQRADRNLHKRRAGVCGQNVRLSAKSCTERTFASEPPSQSARATNARSEAWRPFDASLNGKGIERSAEDHSSFDSPATTTIAVHVIHVGDRLHARILPRRSIGRRRIHQAHRRMLRVVERKRRDLCRSHPPAESAALHRGRDRAMRRDTRSSRSDSLSCR